MAVSFALLRRDARTRARHGRLATPHGTVETPLFMPVGTQAALKTLHPDLAAGAGARIVLANTYHLFLQPGTAIVKRCGGLHAFMGWNGPILTDSGGFQVFSLPGRVITEEGVQFAFEKGGAPAFLGPEVSTAAQNDLGADIIMAFDECIPFPAERGYTAESVERTLRWARRCVDAHRRPHDQALFGIVQGSVYPDLRQRCAEALADLDLPGYAIGGVSVGEGHDLMKRAVEYSEPFLPEGRPRYLMGVGRPEDILEAVERGIDLFDCILPTKLARGGTLFTGTGKLRIQRKEYRKDRYAVDTACSCATCRTFSRAYLHHLFEVDEPLGKTLASIHNVHFYMTLVAEARDAIAGDRFPEFKADFYRRYLGAGVVPGERGPGGRREHRPGPGESK
ncbi:MAG: tRNA guanosine(34) transglycosylase Tgt [Deltaproteobacteria bacterium]|nr:tRNA guanosine(34) transglycosylase Tgt [Deltaproteobacteria bacterium]